MLGLEVGRLYWLYVVCFLDGAPGIKLLLPPEYITVVVTALLLFEICDVKAFLPATKTFFSHTDSPVHQAIIPKKALIFTLVVESGETPNSLPFSCHPSTVNPSFWGSTVWPRCHFLPWRRVPNCPRAVGCPRPRLWGVAPFFEA